MRGLLLVVPLVGVLLFSASGTPQGADAGWHAAMGPYYAALLASARGDGEGTLRQVILLESRWSQVAREPSPTRPPWLQDDIAGTPLVDAIAGRIEAIRRVLPRDVASAHTDLEKIRMLLRDARVRHGSRTFDDAVTDYHEALERLISHTGHANEMALVADDLTTIQRDARRARVAWDGVTSATDVAARSSNWKDLQAATAHALSSIDAAAARGDAPATQAAVQTLKARYYELLALLARG